MYGFISINFLSKPKLSAFCVQTASPCFHLSPSAEEGCNVTTWSTWLLGCLLQEKESHMGMAITLPLQRTLSILFSTNIDLKAKGKCFTPAPDEELSGDPHFFLLLLSCKQRAAEVNSAAEGIFWRRRAVSLKPVGIKVLQFLLHKTISFLWPDNMQAIKSMDVSVVCKMCLWICTGNNSFSSLFVWVGLRSIFSVCHTILCNCDWGISAPLLLPVHWALV